MASEPSGSSNGIPPSASAYDANLKDVLKQYATCHDLTFAVEFIRNLGTEKDDLTEKASKSFFKRTLKIPSQETLLKNELRSIIQIAKENISPQGTTAGYSVTTREILAKKVISLVENLNQAMKETDSKIKNHLSKLESKVRVAEENLEAAKGHLEKAKAPDKITSLIDLYPLQEKQDKAEKDRTKALKALDEYKNRFEQKNTIK